MPRARWTTCEDKMLTDAVRATPMQISRWRKISSQVEGRSPKQCRERWTNHLSPSNFKTKWCVDDDNHLMEMVCTHGRKWSFISRKMNGWSQNAIKNRWESISKKSAREIQRAEVMAICDYMIPLQDEVRMFEEKLFVDEKKTGVTLLPSAKPIFRATFSAESRMQFPRIQFTFSK